MTPIAAEPETEVSGSSRLDDWSGAKHISVDWIERDARDVNGILQNTVNAGYGNVVIIYQVPECAGECRMRRRLLAVEFV